MIHFVVPYFDNEKNLEQNVLAFYLFLKQNLAGGFELVLCNDGSTDRSAEIAAALTRSCPQIRLVGYAPNRGRGFAVRYAGGTCSGDYLIFTDLDFPQTTDLAHILEMIESLRDSQVVVGSRFLRKSETRRIRKRKAVGLAHRFFVRLLFPRLKVRDPDAGFKGFALPVFKQMIPLCRENRWSWDLEILTIARANHFSIKEIPINWNERHVAYVSSVNVLGAACEEWTGMFRIRKNFKKGKYKL